MKKIRLLVVVVFFISSNLIAQTTYFDSRTLNGLSISDKINTYFSLIGRPVPSNYELADSDFYSQERASAIMTPQELFALNDSETVDFRARDGTIRTVRLFKVFRDREEFLDWWMGYWRVFVYDGQCRVLDGDGGVFLKKGNQIIGFEILTDEALAERTIPLLGEPYYYGWIHFFIEGY